jgi:hypothetical protein
MDTGESCRELPVPTVDGELAPVPYDGINNCHDCNVQPGGFHHPGCDMERCPRCGAQLISCGCIPEEEEEDFEDEDEEYDEEEDEEEDEA